MFRRLVMTNLPAANMVVTNLFVANMFVILRP